MFYDDFDNDLGLVFPMVSRPKLPTNEYSKKLRKMLEFFFSKVVRNRLGIVRASFSHRSEVFPLGFDGSKFPICLRWFWDEFGMVFNKF